MFFSQSEKGLIRNALCLCSDWLTFLGCVGFRVLNIECLTLCVYLTMKLQEGWSSYLPQWCCPRTGAGFSRAGSLWPSATHYRWVSDRPSGSLDLYLQQKSASDTHTLPLTHTHTVRRYLHTHTQLLKLKLEICLGTKKKLKYNKPIKIYLKKPQKLIKMRKAHTTIESEVKWNYKNKSQFKTFISIERLSCWSWKQRVIQRDHWLAVSS